MQTRYYLAATVSAMLAVIGMPVTAQAEMKHDADMRIKPGRWILVDAPTRSIENGKALEPSALAEKSREQIVCLRADRAHTIYDAVAYIVDPETPQIKRSAFQNGTVEATFNLGDAHVNVTARLSGTYNETKFDISVRASGHSRDKPIEADGVFTGHYAGACEDERGIPKYTN